MKSILKRKHIAYILSLLMIVGIFLPYGRALAEEEANYSIKMDVNINNKDKLEEKLKNEKNLTLRPSQREVKVYKLKVDGDLTADKMLTKAQEFHSLSIEQTEKNLEDGEKEVANSTSYFLYDGNPYDEIRVNEGDDFDFEKLSEEIEINDLEAGYYLIKETDESKKKLDTELSTFVVDLKPETVDENKVYKINAKEVREVKTNKLILKKVDADNSDIKLDKAEFQLYKVEDDGKEDTIVRVKGRNGNYEYYEDGDTTVLKTANSGKIIVEKVPEGKYYFKELKPAPGYPEDGNVGKESKRLSPGESDQIENKITPILKKIDSVDKEKTLNGAVFEIYRKEDNKKLKFKKTDIGYQVDEKGEDKLETKDGGLLKISNLDDGEYVLKEMTSPEGYEPSKEEITFKVKDSSYVNNKGEVDIIEFENTAIVTPTPGNPTGGFNFVKIDSSKKAKRLGGAKFILLKKEGDKYVEVKQDGKNISLVSKDNGEFKIDGLDYGDYALKEIEAPKNHYITQELTPFEVGAGSISKPAIKIKNEPYKPTTVTSKDNTITTKHTPGGMTRVVKSPLVKTGDIRIVIMAIAGFILLLIGRRLVRNDERLQRI